MPIANRRPLVVGALDEERPPVEEHVRVDVEDPLTIAHLRALLWIHRNHASLAAARRRVQAGRRRPDSEIFARFPLRIVPTYPGDARFDSDFFREFLTGTPALLRTELSEIFA